MKSETVDLIKRIDEGYKKYLASRTVVRDALLMWTGLTGIYFWVTADVPIRFTWFYFTWIGLLIVCIGVDLWIAYQVNQIIRKENKELQDAELNRIKSKLLTYWKRLKN